MACQQAGVVFMVPALPGDAPRHPDLPPEQGHRQGAAAQHPQFRVLSHGQHLRAVGACPEGQHGRQAQHQRKPGQTQHRQKQQPGKPLAVGNVKEDAARQGRQIKPAPRRHISADGGRGHCPRWRGEWSPGSCPGILPWESGSAGGPRYGQRPPSRLPEPHSPGPGAGPRPWPWR